MTPEIKRVVVNYKRDYDADVQLLELSEGKHAVIATQSPIEGCSFIWGIDTRKNPNSDPWRYLCPNTGRIYSHPALSGAIAQILAGFVSQGLFEVKGPNDRLDERDRALLIKAISKREARGVAFPIVGDVLRYPDGELKRAAHVWDEDGTQPASGSYSCGSYCLSLQGGGAAYSGGLEGSVAHDRLKLTDERQDVAFWFFHHDRAMAHNAVQCSVPVRVWEVLD